MLDKIPRRHPDDRCGIQSVEHGFGLIRTLVRAPGKIGLTPPVAEAGMSPSKAHLYLVSFIRLGLVVHEPLSSRYGLGPTWKDFAMIEETAASGQPERASRVLDVIRNEGHAFTDSEHHRGFVGVSSPVFDSSGKPAAITGLGMSPEPVLRPDVGVVPAVPEGARRVSRDTGSPG